LILMSSWWLRLPVSCCWGALGEFIFARTRMPDVVWLVAAGILAGPVSGLIPAGPLKAGIPFCGAIALTVMVCWRRFRYKPELRERKVWPRAYSR
jgi:hypothetical protein